VSDTPILSIFVGLSLLARRSLSADSIASGALMVQNIRVPHLSVRKSVLWQNGWLDPDAVWGDERGRSRDGCVRWCSDRRRGRGSFEGEFGASHRNQWGLCDALFSKYFEDLLFITIIAIGPPLGRVPAAVINSW